uniref:Uncharacterized protein n=1 Tax=Oryza glumipatula TaxID=40148 RepID=A0A0D9YRJ2_9ORYZ
MKTSTCGGKYLSIIRFSTGHPRFIAVTAVVLPSSSSLPPSPLPPPLSTAKKRPGEPRSPSQSHLKFRRPPPPPPRRLRCRIVVFATASWMNDATAASTAAAAATRG